MVIYIVIYGKLAAWALCVSQQFFPVVPTAYVFSFTYPFYSSLFVFQCFHFQRSSNNFNYLQDFAAAPVQALDAGKPDLVEWLPQDFGKNAKGARNIQEWLKGLPAQWKKHGHNLLDNANQIKVVNLGQAVRVDWQNIARSAPSFFDGHLKTGNYGHQVAWFFADLEPRGSLFQYNQT